MPLLRPFKDLPDEAPLGYYRRLAQENRFAGWPELARAAEVSPSPSGLMASPVHLARILGLEEAWTARVSERDKSMRAYHRYLRAHTDAVCPQCLRESEHIRLEWEHVYVVACHRHKVLLIDRCPRCAEPLSKARSHIARCDCGHDLRAVACPPATDAMVWVTMVLANADARAHWPGPRLRGAPVPVASEIISTLCALQDPRGQRPRRNTSQPRWISDAIPFLSALGPLLHDWPTGFKAHVHARLAAADPACRTLNAALGLWYQRLKRSAFSCSNEPFLAEVMHVARESFAGPLGLDAAGTHGLAADKPVSVREAAARLGIRRDALSAAIEAGHIPAKARRFGNRRLAYELQLRDVESLRVQRMEWVDRGTATQLLGAPESVLDSFCAVGAIVLDEGGRAEISKGAPYSRTSIQSLADQLRARIGAQPPPSEPTMQLKHLTSRRVGDRSALRSLFEVIALGKLNPVGPAPEGGLGDLRFRRSEIQAVFGSVGADAGLTIEQVSRITGWKYESVSHWVDSGFLQHEKVTLRGQSARIIMPEHLLQFRQKFLPLADLAHALETRSSALTRRFPNLPLAGAQLLPGGARRGALVRTSELYALALSALEASNVHEPPLPYSHEEC
jgi:hypothetical protein